MVSCDVEGVGAVGGVEILQGCEWEGRTVGGEGSDVGLAGEMDRVEFNLGETTDLLFGL